MEISQTTQISLLDLYRRIQNKELLLPDHQRSNVWPKTKKQAWYASIRKAAENRSTLSGMITVYRLASEPRTPVRQMNDGAQRIHFGLAEFRQTFSSQEEFENTLSKVYITEQCAVYENQQEAINEFINLNKGTICTPYELTTGIFVATLSPGFETIWSPVFNRIHTIVSSCLLRVGCREDTNPNANNKMSRETIHKRKRDNFVLFATFLHKLTSKTRYQAAAGRIKHWESQTKIERSIANTFRDKGPEWVHKQVDRFQTFLEQATALYIQIWNEKMTLSTATAPNNVHLRWWFQLYGICKNCYFKTESIRDFTEKFIAHSEGRSSLYFEDTNELGQSVQKHRSLGLSDMSCINQVFRILDLDFESLRPDLRQKETVNLKPGFVSSHVNAFSAHGNGETLVENAVENLSRSARDMTAQERDRLRILND